MHTGKEGFCKNQFADFPGREEETGIYRSRAPTYIQTSVSALKVVVNGFYMKYSSLPQLSVGIQMLQGMLTRLLCLSFAVSEQECILIARKEITVQIRH